MQQPHAILASLLAVVLLMASTGVPTIIHTCLGTQLACAEELCCTARAPESDECCDDTVIAAELVADSHAEDACCVDTVVIHGIETIAVPSAHVALPLPTVALLHTSGSECAAPDVVLHHDDVVSARAKAPPSPPSLHQLGILLL